MVLEWKRGEATLTGRNRQQRRGGPMMEAGTDGFQDKLERGSSLNLAGGHHSPEALAGRAAAGAAGALRDDPIDDHKTQGMFGGVVGGIQAGRGDKAEEGLPMLAE